MNWLLSRRLGLALPLLALVAASAGCKRGAELAGNKVLLFPTLAERQDRLDTLRLRGAGNAVLVTLGKKEGVWRVSERADWPADAGRVSQYLFVLSQTHRFEAKTANPKLFSRLGVEPIAATDAVGTELELLGADPPLRLMIGREHPKFDSNYVRVDSQAQAWLTDLPVSFDRNPVFWLDRRLIDLPLARIAEVRVRAGSEKPFSLSHRDDRFRIDDAPSAAMHDSHQGDALAAVLDQLQFEELAVDEGRAATERELQFVAVDGAQVTLQAWHVGDQVWVRLAASADQARNIDWARQSAGHGPDSESLSKRIAVWNERFRARRFLLPASVAATLMLSHEQILAGAPPP